MSTKKRRKVIAGNWKMNMTPTEAKELAKGVYEQVKGKKGCDVVVCVPFVDIPAVAQIVKGTIIKLCTLRKRALTPAKFRPIC